MLSVPPLPSSFAGCKAPGSHHLSIILRNLATILRQQETVMKLIQEIRLVQSQNIDVAARVGTDVRSDGEQEVEAIKKILDRNFQVTWFTHQLMMWLHNDQTNHNTSVHRRNPHIGVWSQSYWNSCKQVFRDHWDQDDEVWSMEEGQNVWCKALINIMKKIDSSKIDVEELFYCICRAQFRKSPMFNSNEPDCCFTLDQLCSYSRRGRNERDYNIIHKKAAQATDLWDGSGAAGFEDGHGDEDEDNSTQASLSSLDFG